MRSRFASVRAASLITYVSILCQQSYASVDTYVKSGELFANVTDVLTSHGRKKGGAHWFSADFATDKMLFHNYTYYYDIIMQPYFRQDPVNILGEFAKERVSIRETRMVNLFFIRGWNQEGRQFENVARVVLEIFSRYVCLMSTTHAK